MKHIKREFRSKACQKVKIQLCQNTVMLHIKLKRITNAAMATHTCILPTDHSPPTPRPCPRGHKIKIQLFNQNNVMLNIELKRTTNAAIM